MRVQTSLFRLTAACVVSAVLAAGTPRRPALAQDAAAGGSGASLPDPREIDPPARVGRLANVSGTVSFRTRGDEPWNPAVLNYPVIAGNAFWTEANSRAAIEIGATRVALAPATEFKIDTLTETELRASVDQGEVYLHLRDAAPGETYTIQTPRGLVTLSAAGRYGVVAGDTEHPTLVTVVEGAAHLEGPGITLDVAANQMARVSGVNEYQASVGPGQPDAFLVEVLERERQVPRGPVPPPIVGSMPGGEDLARYGTWSDSVDYGQVWYPQVAPEWVPYRDGRWAYVAPWGWTWVDNAPWGFAPFHYGRWAQVGGRWAWIPGAGSEGPHPVYAPALVTFLGIGAVGGLGVGAALAARRVGWCPLGPREPFNPWYRSSERHVRHVNVSSVTPATVNRTLTFNGFVNRGATTVVPADTMTASRPVAHAAQRIDPGQLAQARPMPAGAVLRPTATTVGVTPTDARHLYLEPMIPGARSGSPGPTDRRLTVPAVAGVAGRQPATLRPALPNGAPAAAGSPAVLRPMQQPAVPPAGSTATTSPLLPQAPSHSFGHQVAGSPGGVLRGDRATALQTAPAVGPVPPSTATLSNPGAVPFAASPPGTRFRNPPGSVLSGSPAAAPPFHAPMGTSAPRTIVPTAPVRAVSPPPIQPSPPMRAMPSATVSTQGLRPSPPAPAAHAASQPPSGHTPQQNSRQKRPGEP